MSKKPQSTRTRMGRTVARYTAGLLATTAAVAALTAPASAQSCTQIGIPIFDPVTLSFTQVVHCIPPFDANPNARYRSVGFADPDAFIFGNLHLELLSGLSINAVGLNGVDVALGNFLGLGSNITIIQQASANITAGLNGYLLSTNSGGNFNFGNISLTTLGGITAGQSGIVAVTDNNIFMNIGGPVVYDTALNGTGQGIFAFTNGLGANVNISTTAQGTLNSFAGSTAIQAFATQGNVVVTQNGAIGNAFGGLGLSNEAHGIHVGAGGTATINQNASIDIFNTVPNGHGIVLDGAGLGTSTITSNAQINAPGFGILAGNVPGATVFGNPVGAVLGNLDIFVNRDINAGLGGVAAAANGNLFVSQGAGSDINATLDGILATSGGTTRVTTAAGSTINTTVIGAGINAISALGTLVNHGGNITAQGSGIVATSAGNVAITTQAGSSIDSAGAAGILALNLGGNIQVDHFGTIGATTRPQTGILALALGGDAIVNTHNSVAATGVGISVTALNNATVDQRGSVDATTGPGIAAFAGNNVLVQSRNTISAGLDGILANGSNVEVVTEAPATITAGAFGVHAFGTGASVTRVRTDGRINSTSTGIVAGNNNAASTVDVTQNGQIVATAGDGIAIKDAGVAIVRSNASINATNCGIVVGPAGGPGCSALAGYLGPQAGITGNIDVTANGAITSGATGIAVFANLGGNVRIVQTNAASIMSTAGTGILSFAVGAAQNIIRSNASITATGAGSDGIFALGGNVDIETQAKITANNAGISVDQANSVRIVQNGALDPLFGMNITNTVNDVDVDSNGNIIATLAGINVFNTGGNVVVDTSGTIAPQGGVLADGIVVATTGGNVSVNNSNSITVATGDGIRVNGTGGNATVTVNGAINTTNPATSDDGVQVSGTAGNTIVTVNNAVVAGSGAGDAAVELTGNGNDAADVTTVTQNALLTAFDGINANTTTGALNIFSNAAINAGNDAIRAFNTTGPVRIETNAAGVLTAGDDGIDVDGVFGANGTATITTNARIDAVDRGIDVDNVAQDVLVTQRGAIDRVGVPEAQVGIEVSNSGANVTVLSEALINAVLDGINVATTVGNVIVTTQAAINVTNGDGVDVSGTQGNTTVTTNETVTASDAGIELTNNGNAAGDVTTVQQNALITASDGIRATTTTGQLNITSNAAVNATDDGIDVNGVVGPVVVLTTANGVLTAGDDGIFINNVTQTANVTTNARIDAVDRGIDINAVAGNVLVTQNEEIDRLGAPEANIGIEVTNSGANVNVNSNDFINAVLDGINVAATVGNAIVTTQAAITVTNGDGVDVSGTQGNTTVTTNGTVAASDAGVELTNNGNAAGDVTTVQQNALITALDGIRATTTTGQLNITSNAAVNATDDGIDVNGVTGPVTVLTTANGVLTAGDDGIFINTVTQTANVTTNARIDAADRGIDINAVNGNVSVTQNEEIDRLAAPEANIGIEVTNSGANVTVNSNDFINAVFDGILVDTTVGNVIVNALAALTVTNGDGVEVNNTLGNTSVTTNGPIVAADAGIELNGNGDDALDVTTVNQNGTVAALDGIRVTTTTGALVVNSNANINATDDGIDIFDTVGPVTVNTAAGTKLTSVDRGIIVDLTVGNVLINQNGEIDPIVGIEVLNTFGNVVINSSALVTATDDSIRTAVTTGTTDINSTAGLLAGAGDAVDATGDLRVTVNLNPTVQDTRAGAFVVNAQSILANVLINVDRIVVGDTDNDGAGGVIDSVSATGTEVNFNANANASALNDRLADVKGGAALINVNGGARVFGFVDLTANADVFNINANGVWQASPFNVAANTLTSTFGDGVDRLNINGGPGIIPDGRLVAATRAGAAERTNLLALEHITSNAGHIRLTDGAEGDVLNAPAARYEGVIVGGDDADLFVDTFVAGPGSVSDEFRVGTTAGVTSINVTDTDVGPGAFNPTGIPIVRTTANGSAANHFVLAGGPIFKGLFVFDLFFAQNTLDNVAVAGTPEDQHLLASVPRRETVILSQVSTQAQHFWNVGAGVWRDRTADLREYGLGQAGSRNTVEPGAWVRLFNSNLERDDSKQITLFNQTFTFDTNYDQDVWGGMVGTDWAVNLGSQESFMAGVFFGAGRFESDYADQTIFGQLSAGVDMTVWGPTAGVYASYLNSGFFIDALVKADFLDIDVLMPSLVPFNAGFVNTDGTNWGGVLDAGYRHPLADSFYGEIVGTLRYAETDIDGVVLAGSTVDFGSNDTFRGRLGLGLGGTLFSDEVRTLTGNITVSAWHEFEGENSLLVLSPGGAPLVVLDDVGGTYGEVSGQLSLFGHTDGTSAFIKADYRFGNDHDDVGVSVGVRIPTWSN